MKVALYCRVSTDEQALNGYSIDTQLQELREYAKKNKYTVVGEYIDNGYSGGMLNRPALNNLLKDIENNKIELVIFVKLDRWFRSVAHYYKIQEILDNHNVKWLATQEDYETITSSGKFKVNIMLSVSQQFKDATSERIKSVFDYKVKVKKEVLQGNAPFGYDIVNKHYVINKKQAEQLIEFYDTFVTTGSINKAVIYWKENISNDTYLTIRKKLGDIRHNGKYLYKGEIITDYMPKIIDDNMFNRTLELLKCNIKKNTAAVKRTYIFSGLVYCNSCGNRFSGGIFNYQKYYVCKKHKFYECSNMAYLNEKYLEEYCINQINTNLELEIKAATQTNKKEKDTRPELNKKIKKLTELYENDLIDLKEFKERKEMYLSQIHELDIKLAKKSVKIDLKGIFKALELYNSFNDEAKQVFWRELIKKIVVVDRNTILIEYNMY